MRAFYFYMVVILISGITLPSKAQDSSSPSEKEKPFRKSWFYHTNNYNYDSSMYYGYQYLKYELKYGSDSSIVETYYHQINSLKKFDKLSEGFKLALFAYDMYCVNDNETVACQSCQGISFQLAEFMILLQDYRRGLEYLGGPYGNSEEGKRLQLKAKIYALLGLPDSAEFQTQESVRIAQESARILGTEKSFKYLVNTHNDHGLVVQGVGEYDAAIAAFYRAIKLVDSLALKKDDYGYIYGNLGSCYYKKGDFDKAYKYLEIDAYRSRIINSTLNFDEASYFSATTLLAEIDLKRRNYQQAILRLDTLMKVLDNRLILSKRLSVLELYIEAYQSNGNRIKYEFYQNQWIILLKSEKSARIKTNKNMIRRHVTNALEQVTLQVNIEKELLVEKLNVKDIEEKERRLQKWLLLSGALLVIFIILYFLSRFRKKVVLKEALLKLVSSEQELLKLKIEEENKSVKMLSQELLMKQDFSKILIQQLKQMDNLSKADFRHFEFFIQNELDVKSTRVLLQDQMGELSSNFYSGLKVKHPDLTELELKLAGMVVMKMSNKEIAVSKNITLESSKKAKNRLKKKMQISPNDEFGTYLEKFL